MMVAKRRFTADYGGGQVTIEPGERVVDDQELVGRYPENFDTDRQHDRRLERIRMAESRPGGRDEPYIGEEREGRPRAANEAQELGLHGSTNTRPRAGFARTPPTCSTTSSETGIGSGSRPAI